MKKNKTVLDLWFFVICPLALFQVPYSTFSPFLIVLIFALVLLWSFLRIMDFAENSTSPVLTDNSSTDFIKRPYSWRVINAGTQSQSILPLATSAGTVSRRALNRCRVILRNLSLRRFRYLSTFPKK